MADYYSLNPYLKQYGGKITKMGATQSGNPNPNVMWGSPSGGSDGARMSSKFFDSNQLGGMKHKRKGSKVRRGGMKSMNQYINPNTFGHTFPTVGTVLY